MPLLGHQLVKRARLPQVLGHAFTLGIKTGEHQCGAHVVLRLGLLEQRDSLGCARIGDFAAQEQQCHVVQGAHVPGVGRPVIPVRGLIRVALDACAHLVRQTQLVHRIDVLCLCRLFKPPHTLGLGVGFAHAGEHQAEVVLGRDQSGLGRRGIGLTRRLQIPFDALATGVERAQAEIRLGNIARCGLLKHRDRRRHILLDALTTQQHLAQLIGRFGITGLSRHAVGLGSRCQILCHSDTGLTRNTEQQAGFRRVGVHCTGEQCIHIVLTWRLVAVVDEQAREVELPGGVALLGCIAQQLVGVIDILINAVAIEIHVAEVDDGAIVALAGGLPVPVGRCGRLGFA